MTRGEWLAFVAIEGAPSLVPPGWGAWAQGAPPVPGRGAGGASPGVADALLAAPGAGPWVARSRGGLVACVAVGGYTNQDLLEAEVFRRGGVLREGSPAEVLLSLQAQSEQRSFVNRVLEAALRLEGGFAAAVLCGPQLVAFRDPRGIRALVVGRCAGGWAVATDAARLDDLGAELVREVDAGEVLILEGDALESIRPFPRLPRRACALEYLGSARAESRVYGRDVYPARRRLGEALAAAFPARADVVAAVPGAEAAALAYAQRAGVPWEPLLTRREEPGRSPWSFPPAAVARRRLVIVADGLRSGASLQRLVGLLRTAGASEVHLRLVSPPLVGACPYGVALDLGEAAGRRFDPPRLRAWLDVESVAWLDAGAVRAAITGAEDPDAARLCTGCFTAAYPVEPPHGREEIQVPLFRA